MKKFVISTCLLLFAISTYSQLSAGKYYYKYDDPIFDKGNIVYVELDYDPVASLDRENTIKVYLERTGEAVEYRIGLSTRDGGEAYICRLKHNGLSKLYGLYLEYDTMDQFGDEWIKTIYLNIPKGSFKYLKKVNRSSIPSYVKNASYDRYYVTR